ncbi:MAG: tRNA (pseudouridine(54)-N(1))-methyltransferase TrmY [Candidatus Bipolaricaulis sp.]|nr:tRNA (pseudouridine(54)-N(1))-methyltransferase TrmY [Candidatus Bipolaricaulis sp.]MDD5645599.1 tRNA (pseudouridine(54)-N(1))-methyltransferase TrmY [Candidatus Bipolaricaulis sp.]
MRRFLILGHKVPVSGEFTLNDLPGSAGRLDVLCRAVGASLFVSHGIRRDTEVVLLIQNSVEIRIAGDRVRHLNPDERSTAALLQQALKQAASEEVQASPGIFVSRSSLESTLDELVARGAWPVVLHEDGESFDAAALPADPAFVLSDHVEFTEEERTTLEELPRLSLGPRTLHTSQCITITHYLLDGRADEVELDLVLCHKVWSEPKAQLIVGLLLDFEIPANLVRQSPPSLYPVTVNGLGEVRIMVRPRDLERARAIIRDYFEEPVEG